LSVLKQNIPETIAPATLMKKQMAVNTRLNWSGSISVFLPGWLEELCDLAAAVTHQVLCEAGDAVLYRLVGDLERGFVLDLVGGERVMQGDAAINRAGDVYIRAVLEQLVFVQGGSQVRSKVVPAVPTDARGIQALVRVSDELRPEVRVCRLDVLGCGTAHSGGDVAGLELCVDFLACPAVERGCLLAAKTRVSVMDGEVPCPPEGPGVLRGERFGGG